MAETMTVDEVEKIILATEPPDISDQGDRIWTRRMAVALAAKFNAALSSAQPVPEIDAAVREWRRVHASGEAANIHDAMRSAINAALPTPQPVEGPSEPVATGPYVDRLIRIFRDRPTDDTSAVVLLDYAKAALATPPSPAQGTVERADPGVEPFDDKWLGDGPSVHVLPSGQPEEQAEADVAEVMAKHGPLIEEAVRRASPPVDRSAPRPDPIRNEEFGFVEFINSDVPYVVQELEGRGVAILMTMESRDVIGYRLYDPKAVDSDALKALQSALGLCDLAATLTGCRGDDDYVNGVREQINAALSSQGSR